MKKLPPLKFAKTKIKPKSKYNNKSCRCRKGHIHKSRFEALVCDELNLEYRGHKIKTEVKFPMVVNGKLICNHYMDFVIDDKIAVEAKGFETATWKIKSKLFSALYPDYKYQIRYSKK